MVVFGGHNGLNRLGDVNIFDTSKYLLLLLLFPLYLIVFLKMIASSHINVLTPDTMTWRQEMCTRRSPPEVASPCAGHTATMVGPHMLLWGGGGMNMSVESRW